MPKILIEEKIIDSNEPVSLNVRKMGFQNKSVETINCGSTSFVFSQVGEIRFGPPYYDVLVEGENYSILSNLLEKKEFLFSKNSFNEIHNLMAFQEIIDHEPLLTKIQTIDLFKGKIVWELQAQQLIFFMWRPNSTDLIYWISDGQYRYWHVIDVINDRKPCLLSKGGDSAFLSKDGRFFIILSTVNKYIRLFDLITRKLVDENKIVNNIHDCVLNVKSFDPSIPRIEIGISDPRTGLCKKINTITISP